jgi:hypothetical protein
MAVYEKGMNAEPKRAEKSQKRRTARAIQTSVWPLS